MRGQGTVMNRANERLAQSDAGIAFLRRMFLRELDAITAGRPAKQWKRPAKGPDMPIQIPETVTA